jgi:hypothetical protein
MGKTKKDNLVDSDHSGDDSGSASEEEYVVEKVVDKRIKNGRVC